jgi:hypothetical protein
MPCFGPEQACHEGVLIGHLLTGYGEIEVQACMCVIVAESNLDSPIRKIFEKRGAETRIENLRDALQTDFARAGLLPDLKEALDDMDWCRQIRNQYSHCQWYWTSEEGLCFVNLEDLAKQPTYILGLTDTKHRIDVTLLAAQENFFFYVKEFFQHLASAYSVWDLGRSRGKAGPPHPKPTKLARPPLHK